MHDQVEEATRIGQSQGRESCTTGQASCQSTGLLAMDKGLRFAIREGGRTVGAGTVSEILD